MKATVFILVLSMILTGCNSASIGIIGGADGPTSIIVSKTDKNQQFGIEIYKKPVRMINVDGDLYYDSGLVSDNTPRCGVMDGSLKKTVNENEIPLKSGESNFKADGYQIGTSISKEVNIDGEWVIFKKYDTYGRTLEDLKYCYYIKGRLNNATVDSEIIVLTENKDITFNDVYGPLLSSSFSALKSVSKTLFNPLISDNWGITLFADNITPQGITLKIEQFGGNCSGELQTGLSYTLEKMADDYWQILETKNGEPLTWNSIACMIKKNDITEMNINWEYGYGKLEPGFYRLKKEIMDIRAPGDFDKETYEVDFTIE